MTPSTVKLNELLRLALDTPLDWVAGECHAKEPVSWVAVDINEINKIIIELCEIIFMGLIVQETFI